MGACLGLLLLWPRGTGVMDLLQYPTGLSIQKEWNENYLDCGAAKLRCESAPPTTRIPLAFFACSIRVQVRQVRQVYA